MQSIKQWHTPSDRAHDQQSISISWPVDSPFLILLLFTSLFITVDQNRYEAGARSCIPRRGTCSITEMSRCFRNEICLCIHYSNEIDEIWPRLLLSVQCWCIRIMKSAWSAEKGEEGKSKSRNHAEPIFMVAIIRCQQRWVLSVFLCTG